MGNDMGTSPISLNLRARAGGFFPPDTNTSSPKDGLGLASLQLQVDAQ